MAASDFEISLVETWSDLASLQEDWDCLLERTRSDVLFLTWAWIEAWHDVMRDVVRPFVLVARDSTGRLRGVAPFYVAPYHFLRLIPCRALRILGDHHTGAEYGDWIVDADREAEVGLALAAALAARRHRWDFVWMPNVPAFTGARERLVSACLPAGLGVRERGMEFSAARLPRGYEEFWRALSSNARSSIQRQRRRTYHLGLSLARCTETHQLPAFLEALDSLNHRRWSAKALTGTFRRKPEELAFYRRFTRDALSRGWLRFFALKLGDEFKAIQFGYAYKGSFLQLQEGFDPSGPPGLGNVLRDKVIESCIREGLTTYDFLGQHTEHKRRWRARVRPGCDLLISHRRPLSAALGRAGVWPTGRFLRPSRLSLPCAAG
jgi:CelD/BcsL family acetyltransferase involved in cellulose biosynthesis